jgi:hypothetical protein
VSALACRCYDGSDKEIPADAEFPPARVLRSVSHAFYSNTPRYLRSDRTMVKERIIIVGIGCEPTFIP